MVAIDSRLCMCVRACVRVCVCARARARACVRACMCVRARMSACVIKDTKKYVQLLYVIQKSIK